MRSERTLSLTSAPRPVVAVSRATRWCRDFIVALTSWLLVAFRPLVRLEIGVLVPRVGHLVAGAELWLRQEACRRRSWRNPAILVAYQPANEHFVRMLARRVPVVRNSWLARLLAHVVSRSPGDRLKFEVHSGIETTTGETAFDLWTHRNPQLGFTAAEEAAGERLMESLGIPRGAPYVCFLVRDSVYLDARFPKQDGSHAYHRYRDADINNAVAAAEALAHLGIRSIRMGAVVHEPLRFSHPMIVDYASRSRSDFGDVFLMSRCKFYLGDTAGFYYLAEAFNRPCAIANLIPLGYPPNSARDIYIFKLLRSTRTGRSLGVREIYGLAADKWLRQSDYEDAGVEVIENTPEEIAAMVLELNARIDGQWQETEEDEVLQRRFWTLCPSECTARRFPVRVAAHFLRSHPELLL